MDHQRMPFSRERPMSNRQALWPAVRIEDLEVCVQFE